MVPDRPGWWMWGSNAPRVVIKEGKNLYWMIFDNINSVTRALLPGETRWQGSFICSLDKIPDNAKPEYLHALRVNNIPFFELSKPTQQTPPLFSLVGKF